MTTASLINLDRLRIASPCPASWEQMIGDDRSRFCAQCELRVYNIAELSRTEVEQLIASSEGRICARLYRRADGTVLTKDCPVGLRALRLRVSKRVAAVFAAMVSVSGVLFGQQSTKMRKTECVPGARITRSRSGAVALATVSGTVFDPSNAVIAGAKVILILEDKPIGTTLTSGDGRFQFESLVPGIYAIEVESPGFVKFEHRRLVIENSDLTNVDVILQPGAVGELMGIVDTSNMSVIDSKPGTTIISEEMIRRLPIQ